jgi:hypothetical protein
MTNINEPSGQPQPPQTSTAVPELKHDSHPRLSSRSGIQKRLKL